MESFWVEIYDRLQGHTASLLVPLDYFVPDNDESIEMETKNIICLYEQSSDKWINVYLSR